MWPTDDDLDLAWRRLTTDPTTAGAFAALVLAPLEADLRRFSRGADDHAVLEAVDTAVLTVLRNPAAYDPARSPLPAYLRMIARRDLVNLLHKERRHHRKRIPWAGVELAHPDGNDLADSLADHPELLATADALDPADRRVFELIRDGERDTAVFAEALGLGHLAPGEQADEVKRAKDRVKARLRRAGRGS